MQLILGIFFHFIGGFASGSFYMPFKKVRKWAWESYWIVGGLFSWLIVPPLAAWLTVPHFAEIISLTSASTFWWTYFWGVLWGVGGLMYGLGMRYLGMSLGNSVLLGFTSAFGALVPSIYYGIMHTPGKTTFHDLLTTYWGRIALAGVILCLIGIYICGKAGVMKERELSDEKKKESVKEFSLVKGLIVCTISGILSACFNYGIESGSPMAGAANSLWHAAHPDATTEFLYQNNVTYVVLLWGGLTTNFIWCMILNARNRTFGDYTDKSSPLARNYFFAALAGTVWFLQFFFYGMGESRLGNGASSWILHMAFIILVANMWGIALREWKGVSRKTRVMITVGIITILLSVLLVGYGNSQK
ncbi:MAG: L-rhamnose/proton symporter RhaT [Bacteroidota bacterium]|nr:L-rhamnose/proton symporter RhaT [Bacteroidota bacterium]MDP4214564.1 L-rhamnose/proton symporter RhaT [Bacteroidota bacterium]MDP4245635.1 L-rhamnose/proton symporter RhaT [Bacteroidota bacterium]MDP4257867.1 L-rhamnose/proton symporter RhaT [Bacteroidota bacterium]